MSSVSKVTLNRVLATDFIKSYVEQAGARGVVLGVSGGIDSAVCLGLAVEALEPYQVSGLWMPYGDKNKSYVELLKKKYCGVSISTKPIDAIVDSVTAISQLPDNLKKGNIMSRVRMMLLYEFARAHNLLVITTSNQSEIMTGYFTKWGDGAGDLAPLADLYKHEVVEIAKQLSIPNEIIQRPPSAELWEGQTDEEELGISYDDLDDILQTLEKVAKDEFVLDRFASQVHLMTKHGVDKIDHVMKMIQVSFHKRQRIPNPTEWFKTSKRVGDNS